MFEGIRQHLFRYAFQEQQIKLCVTQQNYLPIVFSGKIAAFCHQQWQSCAQPSSSYEQFPCRQCELGLEVLLIFQHSCLYLFWLNSANQINQGLRIIRIVKGKTKKLLEVFSTTALSAFWSAIASCAPTPRARGE